MSPTHIVTTFIFWFALMLSALYIENKIDAWVYKEQRSGGIWLWGVATSLWMLFYLFHS